MLVLVLKTFILIGSLSITLMPVLAQTPTRRTNASPPRETRPQPKIVGSSEIFIDRSTGKESTLVYLRNSDAANQVKGSLTGVVNAAPNLKPKIAFKSDLMSEEKNIYPLVIQPNNIATVIVLMTNATQVGEFDVELRIDDNVFGTLKLFHYSFAVTLEGPDPNKADVAMVRLSPTRFTLKNDDPVSYPLIWRLSVNGMEVCGDQLTLPAKGLGTIECRPSLPFSFKRIEDWVKGFGDLFKVESTEGHSLLLYPQSAAGLDKSSPWKIFPVKASLSYWSSATQRFLGYIVVIVALGLGGLASLALNHFLPNQLKQLSLRERLINIGVATANLRSGVGSKLQVLLRLERRRLLDSLYSRHAWSFQFAGVVARCTEGTDRLEARVALVQQIDVLLGRLDEKLTLSPPPSQIAAIESLIKDARVLLEKTQPTADDLDAAKTSISEAEKKVNALNQVDPAFGQDLAKRALKIKEDIKHLNSGENSSKHLSKIKEHLPGLFEKLRKLPPDTKEIAASDYTAIDMAVEKIRLTKEYFELREGTAEDEIKRRLEGSEDALLNLLQLQSWPAMRSARRLLNEMKDDVYPKRFKEKLLANSATIEMNPLIAYDEAPLEFCVCFHDDMVDKAAAKEEWSCEWAFGDHLQERGWTVSHYFMLKKPGRWFKRARPGKFTVEACFRDKEGKPLTDPHNHERTTIKKIVNVQPSKRNAIFVERTTVEFLKLGAALVIALFALVAGAREQILKLDLLPGLIAVFMIGFGADTVKNLLTKSESTP